MSFFLSEVYTKQGQAETFLKNLFNNADTNSLFLFVDNCSGNAGRWFDKLVEAHNKCRDQGCFMRLKKLDRYSFQMEESERVQDLEPYYSKYVDIGEPKRSAPVNLRIYRKVWEW